MVRGSLVRWVLVGLAVLAVALLASRPSEAGRPYDPRSTDPDGTRALVLLVDAVEAPVTVTTEVPPPGRPGRVLVLADELTDAQRRDLLTWVEAGGTLVVADPLSALHGGAGPEGGGREVSGRLEAGRCRIPELEGLRLVDVGEAPGTLTYPVAPTDDACVTGDGRAFVLAVPQGRGTVVALGSPEPWTNALLDRADNAALATELLTPEGAPVWVLERGPAGDGDKDLLELVSPKVWQAVAQAAVAFALLALWRGRRLGRVVAEEPAVAVPGNELVQARAALTRRSGHAGAAARAIQAAARRRLAGRLGVAPTTDIAVLDALVATRGWTSPGTVAAVLDDDAVTDDAALVALVRQIDDLGAGAP